MKDFRVYIRRECLVIHHDCRDLLLFLHDEPGTDFALRFEEPNGRFRFNR